MWTIRGEELPHIAGRRFAVEIDARPATSADVLLGWRDDPIFREWLNSQLAETPFTAFRWETPPVTGKSTTRPFEYVLLDSPSLARRPDPDAFADQFSKTQAEAIAFPNLGGDAILIVPRPLAKGATYGHLAAFVRLAPESQRDALWQAVGEAMLQRIGTRPVWLSTAGAGVSWLHVRLDDRPKYYGYAPYRRS